MALTLGVTIPGLEQPDYSTVTLGLAALDDWKNALADELGLGHGAPSAHLYPATVALPDVIGNIGNNTRSPNGPRFPDFDLMTGLVENGVTPHITMGMQGTGWPGHWTGNLSGWDPSISTWQNWTNGDYDDFLDQWATDAKSWAHSLSGTTVQGDPVSCLVILRICQEMNSSSFPWRTSDSTHHTNNTPAKFIAAWRHIHDRIRVHNRATHVRFHYCPWPTASSTTSITANYPGDDYCQYIGADIYSDANAAGETWSSVQSLRSRLNNATYGELTGMSSKPIILGEVGVTRANVEDNPDTAFADADRKSWFTGTGWGGAGSAGGYAYVAANDTQVKNMMYSDYTQWLIDEPDWPLTHAAYATLANTYSDRMANPVYASDLFITPKTIYMFG